MSWWLLVVLLLVVRSSSKGIYTPTSAISPLHVQKDNEDVQPRIEEETLRIATLTWNFGENSPKPEDCAFLQDFYTAGEGKQPADIIALGIQECEDIRPRREEGHRSKHWRQIRDSYFEEHYECIGHEKLGGMQLSIYANAKARKLITDLQTITVACGVGNVLSNKGGICMLLRLQNQKTIALINAHLAAHNHMTKQRNADYHRIVAMIHENTKKKFLLKPPPNKQTSKLADAVKLPKGTIKKSTRRPKGIINKPKKNTNDANDMIQIVLKNGGDLVQKLYATQTSSGRLRSPIPLQNMFDACIFLGDLNYRLDLPRLEVELFCNDYGFPSAELLEDVGPSNPGKLSKKTKFAKLPKAKKQPKINKKPTKSIAPQSKMSFQVNETDAAFPKFVSDLEEILQFDQLLCQLSYRNVFEGFQESPIRFPPTFKYDKRKGSFDSSVKARCPAWTDRILHSTPHPKASGNADKGKLRLNQQEYYSVDARTSDHRPVCGIFEMVVPIDLNKLESNKKGKREKRN